MKKKITNNKNITMSQTESDAIEIVSTEIKNDQSKNTKLRKRLNHSNFFVTLNTNQKWNGNEEGFEMYVQKFRNAIDKIFGHQNIEKFVKWKSNITNYGEKVAWNNKTIKKIEIQKAIENSDSGLHAHILIGIAHYSKLHLDYNSISSSLAHEMGLEKIYHYTRVFHDSKANLLDYIEKTKPLFEKKK